jgi:hypothetical protein
MTYPTPTGTLPPLTGFTDADTVAYIDSRLTAAQRAEFNTYYQAALNQDPSVTPFQAYEAWITGTALSTGIGTAGTALGQVPEAAAEGAAKAAAGLSFSNPLDFLGEVGDFFHRLTEASTWERIGEVLLGVMLVCVGIAKLTHAVPAATQIAGAVA